MSTYLLLRDNKESGPFTMNDLLTVGLKPYDLVWIQGKSAAWRYPSEVEELKPFAPVIEEQPFDRFFKKPTQEKTELPAVIKEQVQYAPVVKQEELKFVPGKSVFVTLPRQKTVAVERPVLAKPVIKESPASSAITITETPEPVEIKYSHPLDAIKEMYVKTWQQRKNKTARKGYLMDNLKMASVIAGLVFLGVLAGFIIKSKPGNPDAVSQQLIKTSSPVTSSLANNSTEYPALKEKLAADYQATDGNQNGELNASKNLSEPLKEVEESKPALVRIRKETMIKPAEKKEFDNNQEPPNADIDPITGERLRKVRTVNSSNLEERAVEKNSKDGLNELVSVASNEYKRVAFGGIRNLQLTVTNNSKYELDDVIVELQYLKPSEEPLRTENIKFKGVAPNGTSTIRIPDTNRGIKVSYKIINIESKQNRDAVVNR